MSEASVQDAAEVGVVTIHENGYRKFIRPPGHEGCKISTHIFDCLTFGSGKLEDNGCWEYGCEVCARAHEQQFPNEGPCWPHTDEDLIAMGLLKESERGERR